MSFRNVIAYSIIEFTKVQATSDVTWVHVAKTGRNIPYRGTKNDRQTKAKGFIGACMLVAARAIFSCSRETQYVT